MTFLFTDIEGSTELLLTLGDGYPAVLERHAELLRAAITGHRGVAVNTEGDAFFAAFASASDAVLAAIDAQRGLSAEPWPDGAEVRVRMGLHTGEGRLGGDDYVGLDVHRAARIMSSGHGGQVLISGATHGLLGGSTPPVVSLRDLGRHRLRDLPEPEHLWQLDIEGLPNAFPALRSLDATPTNLPLAPSPLVGRDAEVQAIGAMFETKRLVTLTGPGGTGKTRLATAVAESQLDRHEDGVFFVGLQDARDRATVAAQTAMALGVRERPDRDPEQSVAAYLRDRKIMLLLDNFEQVIGAAPLVSSLMEGSRGLRVIVTSREALHISGEQEFAVPPLATDVAAGGQNGEVAGPSPAVSLFVARAREVRPDFDPDAVDPRTLTEIVARLDGLPLAIELAAARIRILGPDALLSRLEHRLPLLRGGGRDRPERQQTLRAAIDWSTDLLDDAERGLFARLSVFAGGWTLDAAIDVCDAEASDSDMLDLVGSLSEKSLVRPMDPDDGEDPRFGMLQVIREYAGDRLDGSGEAEKVRRRHAAWVAGLAAAAAPELVRSDLRRWQRRLHREDENLRAALRWAVDGAETEMALRISGSLWRYWHHWATFREGISWLEAALALPEQAHYPELRASALKGLAGLVYWQGHMDRAEALYLEALELRRSVGDEPAIAAALTDAAWTAMATGQFDEAFDRARDALERYRALGDETGALLQEAWLDTLPFIEGHTDRAEDALAAAARAVDASHRAGRPYDEGDWLSTMAYVDRALGRLDDAVADGRRAVRLFAGLGASGWLGPYLIMHASLDIQLGRPDRAVMLAAAAERFKEELGGALPEAMMQSGDPIEEARGILSAEDHARAVAAGAALSLDEAVALLLDDAAEAGT